MRPGNPGRGEHLIKKFPDIITGEKIAHAAVWQREIPKQMEFPVPPPATHEQACTRVATHFSPRWLRHYASSKLRSDPVFAAAFELLRETSDPLLDVGCGVGLLPFYLRERGFREQIQGLDIDGPKVRCGSAIARENYHEIELCEQDVATAVLAFRGNVAVFDLLHYLPPAVQQGLLVRLAAFVPVGGLFLIRESVREPSARFLMTYAGEIFAQAVSWNVGAPLHFPAPASLQTAFPETEWTRAQQSAWGRTPFNNRLFVFRRRVSATGPTAE
ncbi:MAG: class I SAM-dependent methyltransferase [Chthoniobacterales bacterium]